MVTVGSFSSIASGVKLIWPQIHHPEWVTTYCAEHLFNIDQNKTHSNQKRDIFIGNDVWIGDGVTILPGTQIADGVVVGAGSIVTKHLEPYGIYAGNPAKLIRFRFDETTIERLIQSQWWHLPDADIKDISPLLFSNKISDFLDRVEAITNGDK